MPVRRAMDEKDVRSWKWIGVRVVVAILLTILVSYGLVHADIYPAKYNDVKTLDYAGYGHHSLVHVLTYDYHWSAAEVPNQCEEYEGNGTFFARAPAWITGLYFMIVPSILIISWLSMNMVSGALRKVKTFGRTGQRLDNRAKNPLNKRENR